MAAVVNEEDVEVTLDEEGHAFLLEKAKEIAEAYEQSSGCIIEFAEDGKLEIYDDESAHVECLALIIQQAMARHNISAPIWFEWANTCSKPRIDAYGGGAVVITKDECHWMNSTGWAAEKIKACLSA